MGGSDVIRRALLNASNYLLIARSLEIEFRVALKISPDSAECAPTLIAIPRTPLHSSPLCILISDFSFIIVANASEKQATAAAHFRLFPTFVMS